MPKLFIKTRLALFFAFFSLCLAPAPAAAGGGPENVLLVVNPKSPDSLTIANYYIHLRQIPPGNVFYLPWDPKADQASIADFRSQILNPIIETIHSRRLSAQIDYVVYSSDFPWSIDLSGDIQKLENPISVSDNSEMEGFEQPLPSHRTLPKQITPVGSLNGLTYLWQSVLKGEVNYLDLQSNRYVRLPSPQQKNMPTLGFRSAWQFGAHGELLESQGKTYLLSMALGVTYGRGNTVDEILKYLKRSAAADDTHPRGTIYFVKNEDIRSRIRDDLFPQAVKEIEELGVTAKIIKGTVPINKNDVQGVVMGTPDFDWKASGSIILPGAICDNFTSYGGIMVNMESQTPISEFLRFGAAGAGGTVHEPYAILQKFPLPMIQVHYARGCSLAEAFYQAVQSPYQLLIVGDPLCRPWANTPMVKVSGLKPNYLVKGTLTLSPAATTPSGREIDHFELFVNGSRASLCKPGGVLTLDTALLPDGYHELRVVAVEAGLIQSQGRAILPVITDNHGRKIQVKTTSKGVISPDNPLIIDVDSPGSAGIGVLENSRIVGRLAGAKGQIKIEADQLGAGPVRLQTVGLGQGDPSTHVMGLPIDVSVETSDKNIPQTPSPNSQSPIPKP
ncbi:MAG: hypothetical protein ABSE63_10925 [Thermoguttaceae bacterium]